MNMVLDATPVVFLNPFNLCIETMPVEMIGAYFPNGTALCLEEAAKVACIRDNEAAANLLETIQDNTQYLSSEGCGFDALSVEAPSLR